MATLIERRARFVDLFPNAERVEVDGDGFAYDSEQGQAEAWVDVIAACAGNLRGPTEEVVRRIFADRAFNRLTTDLLQVVREIAPQALPRGFDLLHEDDAPMAFDAWLGERRMVHLRGAIAKGAIRAMPGFPEFVRGVNRLGLFTGLYTNSPEDVARMLIEGTLPPDIQTVMLHHAVFGDMVPVRFKKPCALGWFILQGLAHGIEPEIDGGKFVGSNGSSKWFDRANLVVCDDSPSVLASAKQEGIGYGLGLVGEGSPDLFFTALGRAQDGYVLVRSLQQISF